LRKLKPFDCSSTAKHLLQRIPNYWIHQYVPNLWRHRSSCTDWRRRHWQHQ